MNPRPPSASPPITRGELLKQLVFYPLNVAGVLVLLGWMFGKPGPEIATVAGAGWVLGLIGGLIRMALRRRSGSR